MSSPLRPNTFASSLKVIVDAVRTIFGVAVIVICFLGVTTIVVAVGMNEPPSAPRLWILFTLVLIMLVILLLLIILRIWLPIGLSGPLPDSEQVEFKKTRLFDIEQ